MSVIDRRQQSSERRSQTDRRDVGRAVAERRVRFLRGGPAGHETMDARVVDASASGLRLRVRAELAVGDPVLVEATGEDGRINITARVVWAKAASDVEMLVGCEMATLLTPDQVELFQAERVGAV